MPPQGRSVVQRLWWWLLGVLGLLVLAHVVWALLQPLLPLLLIVGAGVALLAAWNRWRWR